MTSPPDPRPEPAPTGEWTFRREGQVYGPVTGEVLAGMLDRGEVDRATPVSSDDGAWRPLGEVPAFAVRARLAEARLRVAAEVAAAERARRSRARRRVAVVASAGVAAAVAAGLYAFRLSRESPQEARSALLEDFGGGVVLSVPARVGGRRAPGGGEVELPPEGAPATRAAGPGAGAAAMAAGAAPRRGDLVESSWDPAHIEAVVAREQRTLGPCLRAEADRAPGWAGEIPIEFAIGNDGRVAQLWIDGERRSSAELRSCLVAAMERWSFRPFPGERPVVSLSFRIGAR
jgi:hypothetical protein